MFPRFGELFAFQKANEDSPFSEILHLLFLYVLVLARGWQVAQSSNKLSAQGFSA